MKKMKKMKRILAIVLVAAIALSSHVQVLAATNKGSYELSPTVVSGLDKAWSSYQSEESISDVLVEDSQYVQLIESDMVSQSPLESFRELYQTEGGWTLDVVMDTFDNLFQDWASIIGEDAGDIAEELAKAGNTGSTTGLLNNVSKLIDKMGVFFGTIDLIQLAVDTFNLEGETVQEQIMELTILTAQFAATGFAMVGLLTFPYGLILGFLLNFLLGMIRDGYFDWLLDPDSDFYQHYKLQFGNNVYKPNIYIYSQETRDVKVTFGSPGLLTTSIPEYGSGWSVTVDENGQLTDENGQIWEYLFYESITDPSLFQTESGWRIPADTRQETFEQILSDLGFNEQEIADFTEFWTEKLEEGTDYIMYPQSTETVDQAMPMTVIEEPESVERIWFVFAEDDGSQIEEPVGYELTRGGEDCPYYVIEWGGLFLEE
ncbi:MAG: hypothetical protein LUE92_02785 [Clostridiales bacterium]|nr:hypothetical protein [Clostridiales bacterium]